jgi:fructose transport system substrate-binding protein
MTSNTPSSSRRRRMLTFTSVAAVSVLTVAACSGSKPDSATSASSSGGEIKVGLITKTDTNPFFVKMKQGATQEATAKGVTLMTAAGKIDGDNESQVTAVENMVAAGVKGILITPNDTKAIIPAIAKARAKGVLVIALDTPTDPQSAVDALFATNNFQAGVLIGSYAKASLAGKTPKIAALDGAPGSTVSVLRHNGFVKGFGAADVDETATAPVNPAQVVCAQDTQGDQTKGQTAMENCLTKDSGINLVYTINEPAAMGAYSALKARGLEKNVLIVSVDGGCTGVNAVKSGEIAATSQQYPLKMATQGVDAIVAYAKGGAKTSGYTDTGASLITDKAVSGVSSQDTAFGLANCWG